jgi:hypothetical protein
MNLFISDPKSDVNGFSHIFDLDIKMFVKYKIPVEYWFENDLKFGTLPSDIGYLILKHLFLIYAGACSISQCGQLAMIDSYFLKIVHRALFGTVAPGNMKSIRHVARALNFTLTIVQEIIQTNYDKSPCFTLEFNTSREIVNPWCFEGFENLAIAAPLHGNRIMTTFLTGPRWCDIAYVKTSNYGYGVKFATEIKRPFIVLFIVQNELLVPFHHVNTLEFRRWVKFLKVVLF